MGDFLNIFEPICRVCRCEHQIFHSLASEAVNQPLTFCEMLATTIPQLPIHINDGLPKRICAECANKLYIAYEFQKTCIASDTYMRSLLVNIRLENGTEQSKPGLDSTSLEQNIPNTIKVEEDEAETNQLVLIDQIDENGHNDAMNTKGNDDINNDLNATKKPKSKKVADAINNNDDQSINTGSNNDNDLDSDKLTDWSTDDEITLKDLKLSKPKAASTEESKKVENVNRQTGDISFKCERCEQLYASEYVYLNHVCICVRPYKCDKCDKRFTKSINLKRHKLIHTQGNRYRCLICEKTFSRSSGLGIHTRTHHTHDKPFECNVCGKTFGTNTVLVIHTRIHTGERPYECKDCDKSFINNDKLRRHRLTHTGDKPHKCTQCKKAFASKYNLIAHIRIHTGERPYKCNECSKAFRTREFLVRHYRTHSGARPYKCDYCSDSFAAITTLRNHLRQHVGDKTYICDECPKAFRYKKELVDHQISKHKN